MRWQKTARLAIAVIVIAFAAVVFVALRRPAPPKPPEAVARRDPNTTTEVGRVTNRRTSPDGKVIYNVDAEDSKTYPDGRVVLSKAVLTMPDRNGRTVTINGGIIEIMPSQEAGREIDSVKALSGVKLTTSDNLEVTAAEALFDQKSGMMTVPGPVQFTRGRLSGSGIGATYDQNRDVLWLLADAKINVKPDEQGGGAIDATAGSAGLDRAYHYLRLTKPAHVVSDGRTIDTLDLTIQLTQDDEKIQTMTLRGDSRITGAGGGTGAEGMSARDIDLTYAPDGRTMQQAKLMENAVARLAGAPGSAARTISARTIDMTMGPDGSTVTALMANQNVVLELPATADAPARRITAPALNAGGPSGIQTATFTGGVNYREMRTAEKGAAPSERTARSQSLIVETQPGLGAIQQADFHGDVHIVDGETTADARRALYNVAADSFDLSSTNDPGPEPTMNDGRMLVNARTLSFSISTKKLTAETNVRSSMQPAKKPNGKADGQRGNQEGGKMPALLKKDEPVSAESNRLDYDGGTATATYSGNARLWQGKTTIKGDTIVLDDRQGNLTGRGNVTSIMFFEETDSKTKAKQLVKTTASADNLFYDDAKRLATYTTGPTGKAHVVGTQGDVTGEVIRLFLKEGASELERAESDSNVVVKEGNRTATGQHLVYTPVDDKYVMTGSPVEVEERTPTACKLTQGTSITFHRSTVNGQIISNGVIPAIVKQCVASPAPRR